MTIAKVLVANRGEIARRIFRACRDEGLATVAVASALDDGLAWLRGADEVVHLPGKSAAETYLDVDAILGAAQAAGADAIHPGYGFLAENADFAAACEAAGFVFVGPTPNAMRALGSKVAAKEVARAAGVPTIPSIDGAGLTPEQLAEAAARLTFPLLVKASAGGGGRGMRIVEAPDALASAVQAAAAEAAAAFGDDHLLVERFFPRARHIEVQIMGDGAGGVRHVFERECSIQRRYQKIIEESPAPTLSTEGRAGITAAAASLSAAVRYRSAGTVEFLVDEAERFYLLEVNTRLQVEHPVTEAVTGIDLARWQLRLAAGAPLGLPQETIAPRGHAIEARVYAEDPARDFFPAGGRLTHYVAPQGPGIRCDDGVAAGDTVPGQFDPMIAKVIAHGRDRAEARERLVRALTEMVVLGITTNVPYLVDILRHPAFVAGETTTRFLDEHLSAWRPPRPESADEWLAAAAFESLLGAGAPVTGATPSGSSDPWSTSDAWSNTP